MDAFSVVNPATGETLRTHPAHSREEACGIVAAVHGTFLEWKRTSFPARARLMRAAAGVLRQCKDALAVLMNEEVGKTLPEAGEEVEKCAAGCEYYAEHAAAMLAPEVPTEAAFRAGGGAAVTLTGSVAAGRSVAAIAGRALKKCALELGGSDPYLILEDADLDLAAEVCARGRLMNAGQSCIAAKRFVVVAAVREEFERRFTAQMAAAAPLAPLATVRRHRDAGTPRGLGFRQCRGAFHAGAAVRRRQGQRLRARTFPARHPGVRQHQNRAGAGMMRVFLAGFFLALPGTAAVHAQDWVTWDRASDHVVSAAHDTGAACPKARQLSNGEIVLVYHHGESYGNCGSRVAVRRSRDDGATWFQSQEVEGPERGYWGFSNPDVVELGRGRLLLVSAARGKADPDSRNPFLDECRRSGLRLRFSDDSGATWGPPRAVAVGQGRVWEPAVARLPSGELQIFFAIESPAMMTDGSTQCIEFIRSTDGGQRWSAPALISREPGCRNGVPNVLPTGNGHVLCAQEVVGMNTSPWIVDTLEGKVLHYGLAQNQYEFGGAPFLARAPDGGTLLAFHSQCRQSAYLRRFSGAWLFSDIFVQRGDADGRNFGPASTPWPTVNELSGAFFPSLLVLRDGTLLAMASFIHANADNTSNTVVRAIRGRFTASPRN